MNIVPRKDRRMEKRTVLFALTLMLLLAVTAAGVPCAPRPAHAADLSCVQGRVTSMYGTEIVVNGRTYDIAGVPIRDSDQKVVSLGEIAVGRKVDIYFRGQKMFFVLLYPKFIE